MDRKIFRNYIYNIAYQLVKIILPLVLVPYLYSHVTASALGISDFAGSIINWFILFGILGVNTYGNRQVAKVRDNKKELNRTFWEILTMQVIDMIIASICYFVFIFATVKDNLIIYELTGLTLIASMLDITWFYYGVEDFKKASIRNIIVKFIGVALIFTFVKKPSDLWLYVVINSCSELIGQGIMFAQLHQYITFEKISVKDAFKHHFKATFQLFVPTIAISVYTLLDQTMLGYLYSEEHVTYYKTAMNFVKTFLYFITSIGTVMLPRVTNVFYNDKNGKQKAQGLINTTMRIAMMMALPMCFGMMAIARSFIAWYIPSAPIVGDLILMGCPIIVFISMSNVTGIQYMVPVGMYNRYSASVIAGACINFCINWMLIPKYGAYGAVIGSVIAEFTVTLVQYIFIHKQVHLNFRNRSYLIYIIGTAAMVAAVFGIGVLMTGFSSSAVIGNTNHYSLISVLTTFVQIIGGMAVYFLVLYLTKEELCMKMLTKLKERKNHA
ncbi:MAG: oligosaccharide flippase family protein [Solobacterium sp.]|nr:oligosaccharide flippase family protein [Solobacterium sp.]MCH4266452.1 oligosaccharide flippase family protein [Solobacterium sp.]